MSQGNTQGLIHYVQQRWGGPHALRLASEPGQLTTLPTSFPQLDALLGGGLPAGRITTIRGGDSSGATSLLHSLAAECQRREYIPVYLDADYSFDPSSALRAGVDLPRLTLVRPQDPLESLAIAATLARSGGFDVILFDRLGAGHDQGLVSTWLGCMVTLLHKANTAMVVLTGQAREDTYYGGRALAHYSSVILATRRTGWLRDRAGDIVGIQATVNLVKQKTGSAQGQVELQVHWSERKLRAVSTAEMRGPRDEG
ncbi:MAG: DNA recombination/repair protein RecA [Chloroflexota bacterium]|nr:DNA recombination/repair protein RecA [Chloroflexota bacterium]